MSEWRTPSWGAVQVVEIGGAPKTSFTPGLFGFAGQLFCVWVQDGTNQLNYSVLELMPDAPDGSGPAFFDERVWRSKAPVRAERASGSPSLAAVDGIVHLVFSDEDNNLVHFQYLTEERTWGRRTGLLAKTAESPCLAVFLGQLWCVYKGIDSDKLFTVCWNSTMGWSKPSEIRGVEKSSGQRALFELNGQLQLLLSIDGVKRFIKGFVSNDAADWKAVDVSVLPTDIISSFGVNATCVNGTAFMAYSTEKRVATKQFSAGRWLGNQPTKSTTLKTPAITILDNEVVCIWPDENGALQSMTRKALEMPSLNKWMSAIDDNVLISNLTIPGIHDAAAVTDFPFAGTQAIRIRPQLSTGVRYIDLRAGYPYQVPGLGSDTRLCAFHNFVPIRHSGGGWLTIESTLDACYQFLKRNPSEGLLIQIKQDRGANDATIAEKFASDVAELIKKSPTRWLVTTTVPKMKDLRTKIQLVRRFKLPKGATSFGIDVSGPEWLDNTTSTLIRDGGPRIEIQDHWNLSSAEYPKIAISKFDDVKKYLNKAKEDTDTNAFYLNFASANAVGSLVGPEQIAVGFQEPTWNEDGVIYPGRYFEGVNKKLATFFNDVVKGPGRYGTILIDFPQEPEELLVAMLKTNSDKFRKV